MVKVGNSVKVVKGGTLIDGTGAEPVKNSVVVIEDSKITEVGRVGQVSIPSGAEVIDAGGRVVMPGLIDCHTHISIVTTASAVTGWGTLEYSQADRAVMAVVAAKKLLEWGITTIRDVGSSGHIDLAVRDAVKRGVIIGPRIFASDAGLTMTGGHADMLKSVRTIAFERGGLGYGIVDGVTECIKAVREQIRVGADLIKIWATGGVMEVTERAGIQEFSDEEIEAIVKEADKSGRFVAAHAVGPSNVIRFCSEAGVRSIDHGIFNDKESIEMMREEGTYLVPTLIAYQLLTRDAFPPTTREVARRAVVAHENTLKMAKKAGVKIAMGTDSGSPYGSIHGECQAWELELMATRGLTEMESIVAATKTAAECIGIGDRTGTLELGKFADLIIVEGDPLEDIKVFQDKSRIKMVMREGTVYVTRP